MKIKVGVLFGGVSVEHEVSIISALQAIKNMDLNKYEIIPIYIDKKGVWHTGEILKDINRIIKKQAIPNIKEYVERE